VSGGIRAFTRIIQYFVPKVGHNNDSVIPFIRIIRNIPTFFLRDFADNSDEWVWGDFSSRFVVVENCMGFFPKIPAFFGPTKIPTFLDNKSLRFLFPKTGRVFGQVNL